MKISRGYRSGNVEDRRGQSGPGASGGFSTASIGVLALLFRRFGIVGVLVGVFAMYLLGNFGSGGLGASGVANDPQATAANLEAEQPMVELVSFVFDDSQSTFRQAFAESGRPYQDAKLVLFRGSTHSGCGVGQAEMGPFYCPRDEKVYIDLGFYEELRQRLGAPGDFAQAYVIAHEVGHHLQTLLGTSERVHRASRSQQAGEEGWLVRQELQADCYAGVWAHGTARRELLEVGDLDEAMNAASKIGDDALQKQATGVVRPESFTHGTSVQRARWFNAGYQSGDLAACDTFGASSL